MLADEKAVPLRGSETVLGRGPDAHIRLDLPGVSRRHARFVRCPGANGTFVRGERITGPCVLINGDELGFGSVRMTFHIAPTE